MRRFVLAISCALSLTACETMEDLSLDDFVSIGDGEDQTACEERTVRWLEGIPFNRTRLVDMEIRRGEFTPVVVRMVQNETYVLRLRNRDEEPRVFHSPEFFESVAVAAVAIDNTMLDTVCPGPAVELQPGQTLELQLYAAVDGSYDYYDASGLMGQYTTWHPGGVVRIEQAY